MPWKDIIVIFNPDGTARVAPPDRCHVSKKNHEEICWTCPQGECTIEFVGDSPFEDNHYYIPHGGSACTGPPTCGEVGRVYKYNIVGHMKNDRRNYVADPEVEVDN